MTTHNQVAAKSRLGLLLLNKGLITQAQLDEALREQARTGKRLGEVFIDWQILTERQLNRALKKQSRYRLVAAFVAMLLGPMSFGAFASSNSTQTTAATSTELQAQSYQGLKALSDDALADITGQGQTLNEAFQGILDEAQGQASDEHDLGVLDDIATVLNPLSQMLDADVTVKGVKYHDNKPRQTVNEDGSIDMSLPSEIEEIAFRNLRVKGSESGGGFGDIVISGVRFSPESNIRVQIRE